MLQKTTSLLGRGLKAKPCSGEKLLGSGSLQFLQCPQGLRAEEKLPTLASRPHHRWLGSGKTDNQQQHNGRQGKLQPRRQTAGQQRHTAEQHGEVKPRCGEGMGQAGHAERLSNVFGKLHLTAAQLQRGQEATPPLPTNCYSRWATSCRRSANGVHRSCSTSMISTRT